ncbi:MAG: hypothetical protein WBI17_00215 [Clostridiaceae bacterium]
MIKYKLKIIDVIDEGNESKTYLFEKPEDFSWEEGSHAHIGLQGFDVGEKPNKSWVRHMSIMTLPDEGKIGFTTRAKRNPSEFKRMLYSSSIGDDITFFKLGSRMGLRRTDKTIVLLSMGVGIATMRPLIRAFKNDKSNIPSLISLNIDSSSDFIYQNELDELTDENYKNYWIKSRTSYYETLQQLANSENAIYYVVGSDMFIQDNIRYLKSANVNKKDIVIDKKEEMQSMFFDNDDLFAFI